MFFLATALSGCTVVSTDATALISPPKLTKQQQAIEQALTNSLGGTSYTLEHPHNGAYRSSFVLHSFDHGATESVLAFYTPTKDKTGTHVMVLHQTKGQWKETCDISGDGNEIDQILFGNFNGKGNEELAIGWTSFTSTDMTLGIYAFQNGKYQKIYRDTYTKMMRVSMTGSGKDDLLLLKLDSADKKASATLVSAVSGLITTVGQAPLDSTVTDYAGLYPTEEDGSPALLIDSRKGPSTMVTEMVMWKNGTLLSPLYDTSQNTASAETLRDVQITCKDINSDGIIDIPVPVELPGYDDINASKAGDKIWKVQWMDWKNGGLVQKISSVINSTEGYTFTLPDNWDNDKPNVTIEREGGDADWAFYEWDASAQRTGKRLFDIHSYSSKEWALVSSAPSLNRIMQSEGMVYAYQADPAGASSPYFLNLSAVRQRFKLLD